MPAITLGLVAGLRAAAGEPGPEVQESGLPGYLGQPVIVVNRGAAPGVRAPALRHRLAHLADLIPAPVGAIAGAPLRLPTCCGWAGLKEGLTSGLGWTDSLVFRRVRLPCEA